METTIGMADAQEHARLRELLKDHRPVTYGHLRRTHGLSPVFLETQIGKYPEIFEGPTELSSGKPMIRLRDGQLESRDDILKRRVLIKRIRQAGANGIRLSRLYIGTRIVSETVRRLLKDMPEVTAAVIATTIKGHGRKSPEILYKWTGKADDEPEKRGEPEQSRIQETEQPANQLPELVDGQDTELELTRQSLVALCERTHRHLTWLSNYLDPVVIRRVLATWPQDFETQVADLGVPDLIIRVKCSPDAAKAPPVAPDVLLGASAPQASGPSEPLEEIFDAETLEQLRFKPPCVGMGVRRNGRVITKDQRQRNRYPLVEL